MLTLTRQNHACLTCLTLAILLKKHEARTPETAAQLYQLARNIEGSGSVLAANEFLKQYGMVCLEVCTEF